MKAFDPLYDEDVPMGGSVTGPQPVDDTPWPPTLTQDDVENLLDFEAGLYPGAPQNQGMPPGPAPTPQSGGGRTREQIEREGREYDQRHGLIGGYYDPQRNVWVNGSPRSTGGGEVRGPGAGAGAGAGAFGAGGFAFLPFPEYESAGEFKFDPFTPSSWADAENEPGYRAARSELRKQVEAGAAHRGILRSGMTLGDIYSNLDALGQQNFTQFDTRRFRNWQGNRDTAHMGFQSRATDVDRRNNYRFNVADASFKDHLARWQEQVRSLTQLSRPVE